jgi:hypothetical protein
MAGFYRKWCGAGSGVGRESVVGSRSSVVGRRSSGVGRRSSVVGRRSSVVGRRSSVVGRRSSVVGEENQDRDVGQALYRPIVVKSSAKTRTPTKQRPTNQDRL